MDRWSFIAFLLTITMMGCTQLEEAELHGQWKADLVLEGKDTIPADLSVMVLSLHADQNFTYQMTAIESLAGTYQLDRDILELQNRTEPDTIRVQVIDCQEQALTLRMNHEGNERLVRFHRD